METKYSTIFENEYLGMIKSSSTRVERFPEEGGHSGQCSTREVYCLIQL